jgi:hypothetical protein
MIFIFEIQKIYCYKDKIKYFK